MPQMFPLLWLPIFLTVSMTLVMVLALMFFTLKPSLSNSIQTPKNHEAFWKW